MQSPPTRISIAQATPAEERLIAEALRRAGFEVAAENAGATVAVADARPVDEQLRLVALGEVTASVGHELANLVAILVAWMGQLKKEGLRLEAAEPRVADIAAKLDKVGGRFMQLITGIGYCARGAGEQQYGLYPLGELVAQALAVAAPKLRLTGVQVDQVGAAEAPVNCDPGQLTLALVSLLYEALRRAAATAKRTLTIATAVGGGKVELAFEVEAGDAAGSGLGACERILRSTVARLDGDVAVGGRDDLWRCALRLPCETVREV